MGKLAAGCIYYVKIVYSFYFQDVFECKLVIIDVNDNSPEFIKDNNDAYRVIIPEVI